MLIKCVVPHEDGCVAIRLMVSYTSQLTRILLCKPTKAQEGEVHTTYSLETQKTHLAFMQHALKNWSLAIARPTLSQALPAHLANGVQQLIFTLLVQEKSWQAVVFPQLRVELPLALCFHRHDDLFAAILQQLR